MFEKLFRRSRRLTIHLPCETPGEHAELQDYLSKNNRTPGQTVLYMVRQSWRSDYAIERGATQIDLDLIRGARAVQ